MHKNEVGDNVTRVLSCHCNRMNDNKISKGWQKEGEIDEEGSERLAFSDIVKYFNPLFAILQSL